jgi:hypothetical protein
MTVRLSALRASHALLQKDFWCSFILQAVNPRAIVQLEGLGKLKKSIDLIAVETCVTDSIIK